jgi:hypothetical protein
MQKPIAILSYILKYYVSNVLFFPLNYVQTPNCLFNLKTPHIRQDSIYVFVFECCFLIQVGLKLVIPLPQFFECWDYSNVPCLYQKLDFFLFFTSITKSCQCCH